MQEKMLAEKYFEFIKNVDKYYIKYNIEEEKRKIYEEMKAELKSFLLSDQYKNARPWINLEKGREIELLEEIFTIDYLNTINYYVEGESIEDTFYCNMVRALNDEHINNDLVGNREEVEKIIFSIKEEEIMTNPKFSERLRDEYKLAIQFREFKDDMYDCISNLKEKRKSIVKEEQEAR